MDYKQIQINNPLFSKKTKNLKLFICLIVIAIFFMVFSKSRTIFFIKDICNFFWMPSQERLSLMLNNNKKRSDILFKMLYLYQENEVLREKLIDYKKNLLLVDSLSKENKNLRSTLNLETKPNQKMLHAKVIGRTIDDWYAALIINKGDKDGVERFDSVVFDKSGIPVVVGQIIEVYSEYAKVLLITNIDANVIGVINSTNECGVVQGANSRALIMRYLHSVTGVKKGDSVFTTGFGGIFPEDLFLGEVERIVDSGEGKFSEVYLKPASDIFNLEYVSVILES
ncbi:MAG: rod shape-determining protein MreC [bacterium]|nr:rod shape-determining protein MreC [bacterium]